MGENKNKPVFTPEQKRAIDVRNANILVSASAGAGKTAVLTERIIALVMEKEKPLDVDQIVVVTFTRAAAAEMRSRIASKLNERLVEDPTNHHIQKQLALLPHAQITTIDSFCLSIVRNYFYSIELDPSFRIGDNEEITFIKQGALESVLEEKYQERSESFLTMIEMLAPGKSDAVIEDLILQLHNNSMSHPWPKEWLEECRASFAIGSEEELYSSRWFVESNVMGHVHQIIEESCFKLQEAIARCNPFYDDLEKIIIFLGTEYDMLHSLSNYTKYNQFYLGFDECEFKRFPSVRLSEGESKEIKNAVKETRDSIKKAVSKLKEEFFSKPVDEVVKLIYECSPVVNELIDATLLFSDRFAQLKMESNVVDFYDVEHFALEILEDESTGAAREQREQYRYLLIDEYQDSNEVQETILRAISRESIGEYNMFMVGDVKQSIYQFRLAKPDIFEEKRRTYTDNESCNMRIMLKRNFRSSPAILATVNYLFRSIMREYLGKVEYDHSHEFELIEGITETQLGDPVEVVYVTGGEEQTDKGAREQEALAIVQKIKGIEGYKYSDIVILLRSMTGWAEEFVEVLTSNGIPAVAEQKKGYFSAYEIQTVVAMLMLIDNPFQDIPLVTAMKSLYGQFSDEELGKIRLHSKRELYEALMCASNEEEDMSLRNKCKGFIEKLGILRQEAPYIQVHEVLQKLYELDGFIYHMEAMPSGERRLGNLRMLMDKALAYEGTEQNGLFEFIHGIKQQKEADIDFGEADAEVGKRGAVRIMSIHKSKGLEFPVVFVAGMGKRINLMDAVQKVPIHSELGLAPEHFDRENRIYTTTLIKKALGLRIRNDSYGEELRVLYVALTRPKSRLIMVGYIEDLQGHFDRSERSNCCYSEMIEGSKTYFDWLTPCFMRHPDWGLTDTWKTPMSDVIIPPMVFGVITQDEIVSEVENEVLSLSQKEMHIAKLDYTKEYDEEMARLIMQQEEYKYPYQEECNLPMKASVSDIKHRHAVEEDAVSVLEDWKQTDRPTYIPSFIESREERQFTGADRGTLYHAVMQYIRFENIHTEEDVDNELNRLISIGVFSKEAYEANIINKKRILRCCESPVLTRMGLARERRELYLEQPFVMGVKANEVYTGITSEETVLIQGIIDVYFEEDGEMVLVDYKTDRLEPGDDKKLVDRYRIQMECYKQAIEKASGKLVKEMILYSFALGKEIII